MHFGENGDTYCSGYVDINQNGEVHALLRVINPFKFVPLARAVRIEILSDSHAVLSNVALNAVASAAGVHQHTEATDERRFHLPPGSKVAGARFEFKEDQSLIRQVLQETPNVLQIVNIARGN